MRITVLVLAAGLLFTSAFAAEQDPQFAGSCAWGLAEFGVVVRTDCSVNWIDPKTKKTYCFSSEESLQSFLKNPDQNLRKAEQKAAQLIKK
jgi:hypothetical protein